MYPLFLYNVTNYFRFICVGKVDAVIIRTDFNKLLLIIDIVELT
jgi:hypothetical protein